MNTNPVPYCLINKSGLIADRVFELSPGRNAIGRSSENTIKLKSTSVSRFHAEVVLCDARLLVRDLGSRNGTFVDDERIKSRFVVLGTNIRFGNIQLQFSVGCVEDGESSRQETMSMREQALTTSLPDDRDRISDAERKVFEAIIEGLSEREIALRLDLSPHTVHNHVKAIYRAYEVHSKGELMSKLLKESQTETKREKKRK